MWKKFYPCVKTLVIIFIHINEFWGDQTCISSGSWGYEWLIACNIKVDEANFNTTTTPYNA